jgi:hypothetical protein
MNPQGARVLDVMLHDYRAIDGIRVPLTLTASKRIKHLDSWPLKIPYVPGGDRQVVGDDD